MTETWVLNENLTKTGLGEVNISFVSDATNHTSIRYVYNNAGSYQLDYDQTTVAKHPIYSKTTAWYDEAYRHLTFSTTPTGDLLTWLQENGTKQGGGVNNE